MLVKQGIHALRCFGVTFSHDAPRSPKIVGNHATLVCSDLSWAKGILWYGRNTLANHVLWHHPAFWWIFWTVHIKIFLLRGKIQKSIRKATSSSLTCNIQNRVFCSFLKMSFFILQNTQPVARKISAKNPEAGVSTLGDRKFIKH